MDLDKYLCASTRGAKIYLAKEKAENAPKARALFWRLYFLDWTVKLLFSCWILKKALSYFDVTIY